MTQYITIVPQSSIHIGKAKPDFKFLPTQEIIPGSVIRGSLAEYMKLQGRLSEITDYVTDMRFGFFIPSDSPLKLPLPFPNTALSCKKESGFKPKAHGVFDSLIGRIAYVELQKMNAEFPVPFNFKCQKCDARMDRYSGFYVKEGSEYKKISLSKNSQTKVAINRRRKTAEKEMLYSITGISPMIKNGKGAVYIGRINAPSEKIDFLLEALNEIGIGAFTTRGFGKVEAKKREIAIEKLTDRVETFNNKLKEVWKQVHSIALNKNELPDEPQEYYFTIDLLSQAIIKNNGVPSLKLELDLNNSKITPFFYSTSPVFIGGWSTAWGLPKETTYAAEIGSTYVFKIEESEGMYQTLEKIEQRGVGERKEEGYGDVMICHPFHKEVVPV